MNLNPFVLLDILLADLVSAKARRVIHTGLLLIVAVVAIWLAADGNWTEFVIAVVAALYAASNKANTPDESETSVSRNGDETEDASVEPETGVYGDYQ